MHPVYIEQMQLNFINTEKALSYCNELNFSKASAENYYITIKHFTSKLTMPMYQRFYQFIPIKLIIVVSIVHFKIMKLQLLFRHFARINRNFHVLLNMAEKIIYCNFKTLIFLINQNNLNYYVRYKR